MTSVLNSATSAAHHAKSTEKIRHSKASGLDTESADGEFGALFGVMMGDPAGQNLAALDGKASPPLVGLAAQVLGPAVHIITASAPALSDDSLYAFARSQGIDEDALALIFQRPGSALGPAGASTSDFETSLDSFKTAQAKPQLTSELTTNPLAIASQTESLDLGEDASLRWSLGKAADGLSTTPSTAQTSLFGLNGVRNLIPTATQAVTPDPATHPESPHQNLAASLILGASEAAQFARRMEMKQASQRAERVAPGWLPPTAAGTGPTLPAGMGLLPNETTIAALETLIIAPDMAPEDMAELLSGRGHAGEGRSPISNDSTTSNPSAAPRPDQAQRTEQYERLSQRLGEALGQRLAAQIAKGDWRVDLALKPHELGNIDIELKMKEGALQASFSAGQALTRELIADSLPRLKEILSQLGMDVASMNVNVRQNSQHGGNPTPGRSSSGSGSQASKGDTEKVGEVSTSMTTRNIGKDPDGLDVLV